VGSVGRVLLNLNNRRRRVFGPAIVAAGLSRDVRKSTRVERRRP
jgi:hypothetical protein